MSIDGTNSRWRRLAAAAGALTLGTVGLVGITTAAAAAPGPGQDGAPETGSLTIHKYAGSATGLPNDGTVQAPTRPALEGVTFRIREVTTIGGVAVDLNTSAGWAAVPGAADPVPPVADLGFGATDVSVVTDAQGVAPVQPLDVGLYYVTETAVGDNDILPANFAAPFLVSIPQPQGADGWLYDVNVYPKNTLNASEATKEVDASSAVKLGDAVSWTITTPAFSAHTAGEITDLVVTDDLVSQLDFVPGSVAGHVVAGATSTAISAVDFANYFTVTYSTPGVSGGVVTITATPAGLTYVNGLPTSQKLSFTFSTTVMGVGNIVNGATVNFGGGTSDFATANVNTQWGPALITTHDAADSSPLKGAVFSLYVAGPGGAQPAEGATPIATGLTTDEDGEYLIEGLKAGQYWVLETQAPTGYVLPEDAWFGPITVVAGDTATGAAIIDIENTQQSVPNLPMTGANGQLLMTIAGIALILVAGGGALAVRNRSKSVE